MDEINYTMGAGVSCEHGKFRDHAVFLWEWRFFGVGPAPEKGFDTKFTDVSLSLLITLRLVHRTMQHDFYLQSRNSRNWWETTDESSLHHKQVPEGSKGYFAPGRKARIQRDTKQGFSHFCCWILHWSLYSMPAPGFFRICELKLLDETYRLNRDIKNTIDYWRQPFY